VFKANKPAIDAAFQIYRIEGAMKADRFCRWGVAETIGFFDKTT
jgi:hypothetical protein